MNAPSHNNRLTLSAPLLHRVTGFWRWWIDELGGILPRGLRAAARSKEERLHLETKDEEVIVSQGSTDKTEEIGRYPLVGEALSPAQSQEVEEQVKRSREVILYLPANKVLIKTLTLPLVAESNLREVLGFEMDRQTPFTLDQVYYDQILRKRDAKHNSISVELIVTPRQYLDDLLGRLNSIGFQPQQVTIYQENGDQTPSFNLLPNESRQHRSDSSRQLNIVLAVLALALLSATIALPLMNKTQVINALEARIELTTRKAEVVQRLHEEVEQLSTGSDFLVNKKQVTPLTLEIINELTRTLPDDTWINRLTIKGTEIQIQGFSASAAALIPLIESSDQMHNPRFRSSVTTSRDSELERFHLSADITGRSGK